MTRKSMLNILADELSKAPDLPPEHVAHITNIRNDVDIGPGIESVLRAMIRIEEGDK
jgi:hypothetical protein